jgi:hypothetical protein
MSMERCTCGTARANMGVGAGLESPAASLVLLAWPAHLYCSLNTVDLQQPSIHTHVNYFDLTVNTRFEPRKRILTHSKPHTKKAEEG